MSESEPNPQAVPEPSPASSAVHRLRCANRAGAVGLQHLRLRPFLAEHGCVGLWR